MKLIGMILRIRNCDPIIKEAVRAYVGFAGPILFGRKLSKNIKVSICFSNKIPDCGSAMSNDEKYYPRSFLIHLHSDSKYTETLQTLGHELTHTKQFARGELRYPSTGHTVWHNKLYKDEEVAYYREPWEIEAFGEGYCLTQLFFEELPQYHPKLRAKILAHSS
jgi:hypothetical protein